MEMITPGRDGRWIPEMYGNLNFDSVPVTFTRDTAEAVSIIHTLNAEHIAMDTETVFVDKVDPMTAQLRVISIATEDANGNDIAYVFDVKDMDRLALGNAFTELAQEVQKRRVRVYGYNANFDDPVTTFGLTEQKPYQKQSYSSLLDWVDLMFAVSLPRLGSFGHKWTSLGEAVKRYLGLELGGKGSIQLSYDADTELTDDQVRYAAHDAIATLWLADAVRDELIEANLIEAFTLEVRSRAFLHSMQVNGVAFDRDGWMKHLETINARSEELLGEIAAITGGQPTLFGGAVPTFNPDSPEELRAAVNKYCPELVEEFLTQEGEGKRAKKLLQPWDSADKVTLGLMKVYGDAAEMDTRLITLLMEYSGKAKIRQTYGDKMMDLLGPDGRFHSEFTQCLIATGRTSSKSPNAQNFSPLMKPFFTPPPRVDENGQKHQRVILQGDYSQAELRVSAQLTGEPVRSKAFAEGEDQHAVVAGQMFQVDMNELLETEEGKARYDSFRSRAKTINFGLGYGMKAGLLASTLTQRGIITTKEESAKLINDFFEALPKEAEWLQKRDKYVTGLAQSVKAGNESGAPIDFELTIRLHKLKKEMSHLGKQLRTNGVTNAMNPDAELLAAEYYARSRFDSPEEKKQAIEARTEHYEWAARYPHAVVLRSDGAPWEFYSRTLANRRRVFQVPTKFLIETLSDMFARPRNPQGQISVDRWAHAHHIQLAENPHTFTELGEPIESKARKNYSFSALKKVWEKADKHLREDFVDTMLNQAQGINSNGVPLANLMMRDAMSRLISRQANAYRNAPIQGSVADAVLLAFAQLADLMDEFPTAMPVSTVHDSIVVECDIEDARALSERMQSIMEEALAVYVPDVKVVADLDIMRHFDDKTGTIPDEEIDQALAA